MRKTHTSSVQFVSKKIRTQLLQPQAQRKAKNRDANLDDLAGAVLELAEDIAVEAGTLIRRKSGRASQIESKTERSDLVTEVDRECEALIHSRVQAAFPLHKLLGEETATEDDLSRLDSPKEGEWTWIVDPIDGTLNFVGGMPFSTVSIGVSYGGKMEVGVVFDPFHDELFSARFGEGACLNGRPISVQSPVTELRDVAVSVGFPSESGTRSAMVSSIAAVATHVRTVRALGSAALHMSYVASGRLGAFFELDLKPWDVAGGRLIVEEAGGRVTTMDGSQLSLRGGSVLATNGSPLIHEEILSLIKIDV